MTPPAAPGAVLIVEDDLGVAQAVELRGSPARTIAKRAGVPGATKRVAMEWVEVNG